MAALAGRHVSMLRCIASTSSSAAAATSTPTSPSMLIAGSFYLQHAAAARRSAPSSSLVSSRTSINRFASTSTRPTTTTTSTAPVGKVTMAWDDYFKLRKSRRTWGTIAAIPTTLAGVILGGGYFANLQSDPNQLILGFEPIIVYGVAIIGCVGLGWLSGPIAGNALWRLTHGRVLKRVEEMDSVFLRHIQKMRVDPSRQSVNNPVPDYYGERIFSKKQYRQWLRDQAAYRRKATFGGPGQDI